MEKASSSINLKIWTNKEARLCECQCSWLTLICPSFKILSRHRFTSLNWSLFTFKRWTTMQPISEVLTKSNVIIHDYGTCNIMHNSARYSELMPDRKKKCLKWDHWGPEGYCPSTVQFSSVAQSCPTLCNPMNRSMPGLLVHHQLPEFTQTHVYQVGDAIQPSHPLSSPSPPALNPSQHQGLCQWVNSLHEVAKALEFQPQHQSFQWTPRPGLL